MNFILGNARLTVPGIRAPAYRNVDISHIKNRGLTEGTTLQLRAEFFNVFNIVNLRLPNSNRNDPARFGRIFATRGFREPCWDLQCSGCHF